MQNNTDVKNGKNNEKQKAFSNINLRSFAIVIAILLALIAAVTVMTYIIPTGAFQRDENGAIIQGTYVRGKVKGVPIWRVLTAPIRVFASENALNIIMICLFLLIMSGVFNIMEKTNGVKVFIQTIVKKFSHRKNAVVCIAVLVFMLFGSLFGMFEELATLLPIILAFMLSLGFDTMTGVAVCLLSACFGFSAAITNPFSVGLASSFAGTAVSDGVWLRILFFAFVYVMLCGFLLIHVKKIAKNPESSPTYRQDIEKRTMLGIESQSPIENQGKIFKIYTMFFIVQVVILILIATIRPISGLAIPILSVSFLIGGIVCGLLSSSDRKGIFKWFLQGCIAMLPAVVIIAFASSVNLIMSESGILDTVMNKAISSLEGKSPFVCVVLVYLLILFLQVFIGSASAKIFLIMPILVPICSALNISPSIVILTYCMADGFTDMILPTNPVLLIGLSMADVSYGKWIKWTWLLQIAVFVFTLLILYFAILIHY